MDEAPRERARQDSVAPVTMTDEEIRVGRNAYSNGERTPEAREAWRIYRRDKERERWARLRAQTGMTNIEIREHRQALREGRESPVLLKRQAKLEEARALLRDAGEIA